MQDDMTQPTEPQQQRNKDVHKQTKKTTANFSLMSFWRIKTFMTRNCKMHFKRRCKHISHF